MSDVPSPRLDHAQSRRCLAVSGVTQTTTRVSVSVSPPTTSAVNDPWVFTITEKAPTRAFS